MAIGNAVIDQVLKANFLDKVKDKGDFFKQGLESLKRKYPEIITEVKGEGLLLGIEIKKDYTELVEIIRKNGALTIPASNDVIRIIPPLIIKKKEIKLALSILDKSLEEFRK